ncbi:MAG TPA: HAD-IC family P-type ATPase, partial [Chitinophagaceae bacterium]|nr:HAD-IC family P-type ATPase [Chitinophagaceae bacterium]
MGQTNNTASLLSGLSLAEVAALRQQYGPNAITAKASSALLRIVWRIVKEPMFIMLVVACSLYFLLGNTDEGFLMLFGIAAVAAISLFQDIKSANALAALQAFAAPKVIVVRNGFETQVPQEELVPGDIIIVEEGMRLPADAIILEAHDCTVNESLVTGESYPVEKTAGEENNRLYQGTSLSTGKCIARVSATGRNTELGKIGKLVDEYRSPKTRLQNWLNSFVIRLSAFGLAGFVLVLVMNYLRSHQLVPSLLFALTLAMSAVPEEIPVAFTSFMALGAYKLSKLGIISRGPGVVENLGAVNVICFDKTGTLTENKMELKIVYDFTKRQRLLLTDTMCNEENEVLAMAILASEAEPFDAMEKAILSARKFCTPTVDQKDVKMIHEYPLEGRPPMMTHVYQYNNSLLAAGKGAPERVLRCCHLAEQDQAILMEEVTALTAEGYRVLAVAAAICEGNPLPPTQDELPWQCKGLVALQDPLKENVPSIIRELQAAKVNIKLVTGDSPQTARQIARQAGILSYEDCVTGDEIMHMNIETLRTA